LLSFDFERIAIKSSFASSSAFRESTSKIKNNKVTAIRFSTLAAICEALNCDAGDILEYREEDKA
jgi:DNA-binding Xre family transcriptional regulator